MERCYFAHGGKELVVGGKLTFLPGATVEGVEGLFDNVPENELVSLPAPHVADSTATTVAQLREDFNRLIAALTKAGLLEEAPAPVPDEDGEAG